MSDERLRKAEALKKAKEEFMENNKSNATPFFVEGQSNANLSYVQTDLPNLPAVHFRGCKGCQFTIPSGTTVVKVLFENCQDCTLTLDKCVISTATLEIWRSDNCKLSVDCFIGTLQAGLAPTQHHCRCLVSAADVASWCFQRAAAQLNTNTELPRR